MTKAAPVPTLHLVHRLYGGENRKGRPDFYSKRLALASFLAAAVRARSHSDTRIDVVVLADGPIRDEWRGLAGRFGARVIDIPGGPVGMKGSYLAGLRLPDRLGWPDEDLMYLAEDDYLTRPEAFVALLEAARTLPETSYFALYASTPAHPATEDGRPTRRPADFHPAPDIQVGDQRWVNVPSTTSSFGARVGVLRADLSIFRQGTVPYPHRLLDHETCLVYQGRLPFWGVEMVIGPPETRFYRGLRGVAVNAALLPFRLAFNGRALTRRRRPHRLYAADPNLACHLETAVMSTGVDWDQVAERTAAWLDEADRVGAVDHRF